jgi:hypothetical protein
MSNTVTIRWSSATAKNEGAAFNQERALKFLELGLNPNTDLINEPNSDLAIVTFKDLATADQWVTFIQGLASKYNKQIIEITIT